MKRRDEDLLAELTGAGSFRRVEIAAELGDAVGDTGPDELRRLLRETGPGTSDLRCASVLALAKRCRDEAHDDFVAAFHSRDAGTREYAVLALGAFGRDGLWDEVADRLGKHLRNPRRRDSRPHSSVVAMITYLVRHAPAEPDRLDRLVEVLRRNWRGLDPARGDRSNADWIRGHWPEVGPGGPPTSELVLPDVSAMQTDLRWGPLFRAVP